MIASVSMLFIEQYVYIMQVMTSCDYAFVAVS